MLTRDAIRNGHVRRMIMESGVRTGLLDDDQLEHSRQCALDRVPIGRAVWVFGYGSLIWNPAFQYETKQLASIHGYHRQFCLWTHAGRGTETRPGLMLALDLGGSCRGQLFRIAPNSVEEETRVLWAREMLAGSYCPRWVRARTAGGVVDALTFIINRRHTRYAGRLPMAMVARTLATARGAIGTNVDYLNSTIAHLRELGIRDRSLEALYREISVLLKNTAAR